MKKFVLIHIGYETPTKDIVDAWMGWFKRHADKFTDSGNPFGAGKEVTKSGVRDLPHDISSISGYTIIKAVDMNEALNVAKDCPLIHSMHVYEAMSM